MLTNLISLIKISSSQVQIYKITQLRIIYIQKGEERGRETNINVQYMRDHVSRVARTCFFHLRRLLRLRRQLGRDVTARLVSALVLSRLDYCNAILVGLPQTTLSSLQRVLHAAARMVLNLRPCDHVTPALLELHWLPIAERIDFKLSACPQGTCWACTSVHCGPY